MDLLNIIIGILLVVLSIWYLIYTIRSAKKDKNYRYITFSYDIEIVVGTLTFIAIGLIMIYRELKYIF